jgi:hypothetical protein
VLTVQLPCVCRLGLGGGGGHLLLAALPYLFPTSMSALGGSRVCGPIGLHLGVLVSGGGCLGLAFFDFHVLVLFSQELVAPVCVWV